MCSDNDTPGAEQLEFDLGLRSQPARRALFPTNPVLAPRDVLLRVVEFLSLIEGRRVVLPVDEICYSVRRELEQIVDDVLPF